MKEPDNEAKFIEKEKKNRAIENNTPGSGEGN